MEPPIRKRLLRSRASQSRNAAAGAAKGAIDPAIHAGIDTQPRRFLLGVARQTGIGDPESCGTVLAILSASRAIRRALGRELGFRENSGSRFAILVTLYALSPLPASAADLAYHAEVSRASIADLIEGLEQRGLIVRDSGNWDRDALISLTELGQQVAVSAVHHFLRIAGKLAGGRGASDRAATLRTCRQIEIRAGETGLNRNSPN